jgi:hypothetical protein
MRDDFDRIPGKTVLIVLVIVIAVSALFYVPIKLPYVIKSFGQIQPAQKWILSTGTDGQLVASTINFKTGVSDGYRVSQFAREGTMKLQFRPGVVAGGYLQTGDTVAAIYSSETEERLIELKGELAAMRASLAAGIKGEKESTIRECEANLLHAKERAANQQLILERQKALYQRKMITQEEYEIVESENRLLALEIEIAAAQLETARTGLKPEQVDLLKTQVTALTDQIEVLEQRIASFSIISPLSGKISHVYYVDTLLIVSDISTYVALVPIQIADAPYVYPGQDVQLTINGHKGPIAGHMASIDPQTHLVSGQQACIGTVMIESCATELSLGMISRCAINCGEVTVGDYIKRLIGIF